MRIAVATWFLVAILVWGGVVHVRDLIVDGSDAYVPAPAWLAGYWISLTVLDPVAAVLVALRRRAGPLLAAAVLITDAVANAYAVHVLGMGGPSAATVQPVVAAVEFVAAGVAVRLWRAQPSSSP